MADFIARRDELHVGNGKLFFAHPIAQIENFGAVAVVRLDVPPGVRYNENVFGVSADAQLLWQIQKEPRVYQDSSYTNLARREQLAVASNWDGGAVLLEHATGKIVERSYGK